MAGQTIINVHGKLTIAGIIVTRVERASGIGVFIDGNFIMTGGEISENIGIGVSNNGNFTMSGGKISDNGDSGVRNNGNFTMTGGEIAGNTAPNGGGVYNNGKRDFIMSGGKIADNAAGMGGGVYNGGGTFTMSGGTISGNVANGRSPTGGGVNSDGEFIMSGGEISSNTAGGGGGVSCNNFMMSGGKISDNTADIGGGVRVFGAFDLLSGTISGNTALDKGGGVYACGKFNMTGGTISGNNAEIGGGVCNDDTFTMSNGAISSNTANNQGGGVYHGGAVFELLGGRITDNTATNSGGGIWVAVENLGKLFVYDGVTFADNRASIAYNRDSAHDDVYSAYIGRRVTWTSPFTQGYNNYDISYTSGTQIPGAEPSPSEQTDSSNSAPPPRQPDSNFIDNIGTLIRDRVIWILVLLIILAIVVIGYLLHRRKRGKWSQSTYTGYTSPKTQMTPDSVNSHRVPGMGNRSEDICQICGCNPVRVGDDVCDDCGRKLGS